MSKSRLLLYAALALGVAVSALARPEAKNGSEVLENPTFADGAKGWYIRGARLIPS